MIHGGMPGARLPDEAETRRLLSIAEADGFDHLPAHELERVEGMGWLVHVPTDLLYAQSSRHMAGVLGRTRVKVTFEGPLGRTDSALPSRGARAAVERAAHADGVERAAGAEAGNAGAEAARGGGGARE
jgi:hypothetical protein